MIWESWSAFWEMGGAAYFVWGSYGLTAALVILEIGLVRARRANSVRRLISLGRLAGSRKMQELQS